MAAAEAGESQPDGFYPEDVVMAWFVQLLMALHHLHVRHILHRDLKVSTCAGSNWGKHDLMLRGLVQDRAATVEAAPVKPTTSCCSSTSQLSVRRLKGKLLWLSHALATYHTLSVTLGVLEGFVIAGHAKS